MFLLVNLSYFYHCINNVSTCKHTCLFCREVLLDLISACSSASLCPSILLGFHSGFAAFSATFITLQTANVMNWDFASPFLAEPFGKSRKRQQGFVGDIWLFVGVKKKKVGGGICVCGWFEFLPPGFVLHCFHRRFTPFCYVRKEQIRSADALGPFIPVW